MAGTPDTGRRLSAAPTTASAPAPPRVRTLIVDDSETVRNGLGLLFETQPSCELVGAVGDADTALELTRTMRPHVVLQDFSMPGVDTLGLIRSLSACDPQPAILVLSAFADGPSARKAAAAGALGWLLKDAEPREIFAAVLGAARLRSDDAAMERNGTPEQRGRAREDRDGAPRTVAAPSAVPSPEPRIDLEVTSPIDARTVWALLRALDSDPGGLPVETLASRAVVTLAIAARYVQRMTTRRPAFVAVAGTAPEGPRYALTAAGHGELARLEGRTVAGLSSAATQLLR